MATLLLQSSAAFTEDFFGPIETTQTATRSQGEGPWRSRVWLQQKTGFGYRIPAIDVSRDSADLTRTETELFAETDWRQEHWRLLLSGSLLRDWLPDLERAGLWSGYEFTPAQQDARDWRWEASDSYVSWQDGNWWIKAGYQTLAWGEAETLKVTDVLARRDQRWPGQEDLEELRLPVPALSLNWRNNLDLVLLPNMPLDREASAFDEFDPYIRLRNVQDGLSPELMTERDDSPGWAVRWQSRKPGLDYQLILADVYSFEAAPTAFAVADLPTPALLAVMLKPWRQQVVGMSLQSARGNWLFKTEQAWHHDTHLPLKNPQAHDQWRATAAAEYSGVPELTITGEFGWIYTHEPAETLVSDQWQTSQAMRFAYNLFNQRLALNGLAMRLAGGQGNLMRVSANWTWSDQLALGLSLVEYAAGNPDQTLYDYRNNDTLLLTLRWGLL